MSGNGRSDDIQAAFPPKADIARRGWKVRPGPKADVHSPAPVPCSRMSAERGEPNGELILCDPASLDRALAARPARSPISRGIPQTLAISGSGAKAPGGSGFPVDT